MAAGRQDTFLAKRKRHSHHRQLHGKATTVAKEITFQLREGTRNTREQLIPQRLT